MENAALKHAHFKPDEIADFHKKYLQDHVIQVPAFLPPETVQKVLESIVTDKERESILIAPATQKYYGSESIVTDPQAHLLVHLILNQPTVIEFMKEVTGDASLRCFLGRIYKMDPAKNHELGWHGDNVGNRRVGVSVNLTEKFGGSAFQIREKGHDQIHKEIRNGSLGSMLVFSIDPHLEHQLTPLEGSGIKIAIAGWFMANEDFSLEKIYGGLKI